ncbi:MAG: glutathione S-transferase [Rubrivivax sp.]|nr:glutathione S-transferase [Rubrivivax sp.]
MWTLYGSRGSGSAAVEMALQRCGVPWREVRASTWEPDSAQDELRRANPLGQIPTLVLDDGSVLTESAAILIHLGLTQPQAGLLPAEAAPRAQAMRALVFIAANCYAAIGVIDYPERWLDGGGAPAQERLRAGARRRLHEYWTTFADQFGGLLQPDRPGAAEMLAAVVSRWSGARAHLAAERPVVHEALAAVERHPDLAPVFERHWPRGPAAAGG